MLNEVLELVKAGFTKEEILALSKVNTNEPKANPEGEPKTEPKEEPKSEPKEEPKTEPKTEPQNNEELNGLTDSVKELIETMRANAITNSRQQMPEDVDAVLAKIINPNSKSE